MGYLIKWIPFTYEENTRDEIYRCYSEPIYEYHTDESEFLFRCGELENFSGELKANKFCDGVEIEMFYCDLRNYKR